MSQPSRPACADVETTMSEAIQPTFERANEIHDTGSTRVHLIAFYRPAEECWVARLFDEAGHAWEGTFDSEYAATKRVRGLFWAENPSHKCNDRCVRLGGGEQVPLRETTLSTEAGS